MIAPSSIHFFWNVHTDRIPELLTLDAKWEETYEDYILLTKCRLHTLLTILAVQKIHGAHNLNDDFHTVTAERMFTRKRITGFYIFTHTFNISVQRPSSGH